MDTGIDRNTQPVTVAPLDLSGWPSGDSGDRSTVASAFDDACRTIGFLSVTGHGIPTKLLDEVLDVSAAFFDLDETEKLRARTDDLVGNRGYAPFESEALSYSRGVASPPDLFEAFNVGPSAPPSDADARTIERFFAPNVWPGHPPELRDTWERYWAAVERLGLTLMDVAAAALGLPDGWFRQYLRHGPHVMRANNYVRRPGEVPIGGQMRMGAHSDYGSLTILLADPVPGLQIRDPDGGWNDVVPRRGELLVNLGDLLAEWTNDRWRSTVHRVVPPPDSATGEVRRRSIAWFQQPDIDAPIEVLDACCDAANPPRYPPTTAGAHLLAKLMGPRTGEAVDVDDHFLD